MNTDHKITSSDISSDLMFILKVQKFVDNGGWSSDTVRTGLGKGVTVARLYSSYRKDNIGGLT